VNRTIKHLLKKAGLYRHYQNWSMWRKQRREFRQWQPGDTSNPPHIVKQKVLKEYAEQFDLRTLVETGTLHGDMIESLKKFFEKIYSIELSKELYAEAVERFANDNNVELIQGDSGVKMADLVSRLEAPALFWLDGHYSGGYTARGEHDTPIYKELSNILSSPEKRHVIIIDDARCFGTEPTYPTMEELTAFINSKRSDLKIEVEGDSIRITPATEVTV
jgi:hypothetical protein